MKSLMENFTFCAVQGIFRICSNIRKCLLDTNFISNVNIVFNSSIKMILVNTVKPLHSGHAI